MRTMGVLYSMVRTHRSRWLSTDDLLVLFRWFRFDGSPSCASILSPVSNAGWMYGLRGTGNWTQVNRRMGRSMRGWGEWLLGTHFPEADNKAGSALVRRKQN
jgi:hypothetical protein